MSTLREAACALGAPTPTPDTRTRIIVCPPHWGRGTTDAEALQAMRRSTGFSPTHGTPALRRFCAAPDAYIDGMGRLYGGDPDTQTEQGTIHRRGHVLAFRGASA